MSIKKIFSAIQPTGNLTIGHYIGILKNWLLYQDKYICYYCIADLHSLTSFSNNKFNNNYIKKYIYDSLSLILALGINPNKSIIFLQSDINEHLKLYWLLNCYTYVGELYRMNQFKSKYKDKVKINCGLLNYPILMSSDILLYNTDYVIIGYDQIQHIELTRTIAKRINNLYKKKIFKIPKYILSKNGSKIMSLMNPKIKMSKSDLNKNNVIYLLDNIKDIKYKIINSITDSQNPSKIFFDKFNKPGISNLLNILSNIIDVSINKLENKFLNISYKKFKDILIDKIIFFISNLQKKYFLIRKKKKILKKILKNGKLKAKEYANNNIKKILNYMNINYD